MKLIHTADIHLGSRLEANLVGERARIRRKEILSSFAGMVKYAAENGIDGVLICGDLFDSSLPAKDAREEIISLISDNPQITFFYLRGNHDECSFFTDESKPDNLKTFGEGWSYYEFGDIMIAGCEDIYAAGRYDQLELDPDRVNLVMLHGMTVNGKAAAAQPDNLCIKELKNKNIDYLALGHIHSYRQDIIDRRGIYCYPGCPEGRGFDECGQKGFVVLDIDGGKVSTEFMPCGSRQLIEVSVDISNIKTHRELENAVFSALENIPAEWLVKVILTGEYHVSLQKDLPYILSELNGKFFFAKIYDQSRIAVSTDSMGGEVSLRGEFIRTVGENIPEGNERDMILEYGIRALCGEELD